jgi:hypothetical protein
VSDPNIHRPEWDFERDEPPFRGRAMRLGPRTGSQDGKAFPAGADIPVMDAVAEGMRAAAEHEGS